MIKSLVSRSLVDVLIIVSPSVSSMFLFVDLATWLPLVRHPFGQMYDTLSQSILTTRVRDDYKCI